MRETIDCVWKHTKAHVDYWIKKIQPKIVNIVICPTERQPTDILQYRQARRVMEDLVNKILNVRKQRISQDLMSPPCYIHALQNLPNKQELSISTQCCCNNLPR